MLKQVLFIVLMNLCPVSMLGMQAIRCMHTTKKMWPPLLWCTHEAPTLFAKKLKDHNIPISSYVESQLQSARKKILSAIQSHAGLTDDDIKNIANTLSIMRAYDKQAAQLDFLKKTKRSNKAMHKQFPEIDWIAKQCNASIPYEIAVHKELPVDLYATRLMYTMIFDIDGALMLAKPDIGTFQPTQLVIGPTYYKLQDIEQDGALARNLGGHMPFEHATERYLLKEVMKKRNTAIEKLNQSLATLQELHDLEADLIPASKSAYLASCVLAWLELETRRYLVPNSEERMLNLEAVSDLLSASKKNQ